MPKPSVKEAQTRNVATQSMNISNISKFENVFSNFKSLENQINASKSL